MQKVEAGMAQQLIAQRSSSTEKDVFVPSNIQPGTSFVQVCWDYNDLLEETLTGIGTNHCTNGIAIQRQVQLASLKHSLYQCSQQAREDDGGRLLSCLK